MPPTPVPPTPQAPGLPVGYNPTTGTVDPTVATGAALPQQKPATMQAAPPPSAGERLWDMVKTGIPAFNSQFEAASHTDTGTLATGEHPEMQLITPQAGMTESERHAHPIATGIAETVGELTQPGNVAMLVGMGGLGDPAVANTLVPRLISLGFSAQALHGAYKTIPAFKKAMDSGNASEAERLLTHMVLDTAMGAAAGQHGVEGVAEGIDRVNQGIQDRAAAREEELNRRAENARNVTPKGLPAAEPTETDQTAGTGRFAALGGIERRGPTSFGRTGGKFGRAVDAAFQVERQHAALEPTEPNANKEIAVGAQNYNTARGAAPISHAAIELPPAEKRAELADAYDKMSHEPNTPAVKKAYDAMKQETLDQYNYATKRLGIKIDFTDKDPYENAEQMQKDVRENHHLSVFTGSGPQGDHPLSEIEPTTGQTFNNLFRATHDLFGHAAGGFDFSERGEENAYNAHRQMYSPEASKAVRTETQGQSNWFFNNKNVRENPDELGAFAPQKAGLLPEEKSLEIEPSPASAPGVVEHPALQALSQKYETAPVDDRMKYMPTFIRPDGDAVYIGQQTHVGAVNSVAPEYKMEADRTKFVNDSGAIRVRPMMDAREGETFNVIVPKGGVTPEQVQSLQKMMASLGSRGNLRIETADTPSLSRNNMERPEDWQYVGAADVPKILGKLGVMPNQRVAFPEGQYLGGHMPKGEDRLDLGDLSERRGAVTQSANEVEHHEWGHIAAAVASGLPLDNAEIWSINHPNIPRGALAATHFDWTQIPGVKDEGNGVMSMSKDTALTLYKQLLQNNVGGGVIEQLIHGTPMFTNAGMSGDMQQARALLKYLGFSADEANDAFRNASQTMLQKLNNPKVLSIIKDAASSREEGLPNTHLASTEKVQAVATKIREALYGPESESGTKINVAGNAAGAERSGEATQPGGAGEVQKGTVAIPVSPRTATVAEPETEWADTAADMMKDQDAGAIDPRTGKSDTEGVGVEIYPEGRLEKPLKRRPTAKDIQQYYDQHKDIFEKHPELRIGWDHTKSGWELNIGASGTAPGATLVGRRLDQRAAWDIANQKEIPTGGTGTKTRFNSYPLENRIADLTGKSVESLPTEIRDNPHLMDEEKTILASKPSSVDEYEDMRRQLPPPEELAETAKAGVANRFWYDRARKAFDTLSETAPKGTFKEGDRDRFAAAFAATSPQQDPNLNLRDALDVYKAWLDDGRPTDEKSLTKLSNRILKLEAHIPNTARAFTDRPLSGPKVSSFLKNLTGNTENVTNDMWGAVTNGVSPDALAKPGAYIALSENYRRAAQLLGWTPEQAQAASWGFVRTLGNVSGWKGQGRWLPPQEVLPFIDDPLVRQFSADIADIMLTDPDVRDRLQKLGVNLDEFDTKLKAATEELSRGGPGKTEGVDTSLLAPTARRVGEAKQRAKEQLAQGKRVAGKMRGVLNRNLFDEGGDLQLSSIAQRVASIKNRNQ